MPDSGILSLFAQATPTVQFVLGLLVLMSLTSWSIIFYKLCTLTTARSRAEKDMNGFIKAPDLRAAIKTLSGGGRHCHQIAMEGVGELNRLDASGAGNAGYEHASTIVLDNVRRSLRRGVGAETRRLTRSLSFLATCANAAPFIGLFGTVWGIMHSFHAIGQMKTASLAAVAPGISEALVATAIGLAVAIPATIAYNFFLSKVSQIENELVNFAGAFLNRVESELPSILTGRKSDSIEAL